MLFVRRKPNDIARSDFFNRPAFTLRPAKTERNDQRLTERMRMPGSTRTRLERDARATRTCRFRTFKYGLDSN
jgi:hypothetical protein